jgi:hypothetical protein
MGEFKSGTVKSGINEAVLESEGCVVGLGEESTLPPKLIPIWSSALKLMAPLAINGDSSSCNLQRRIFLLGSAADLQEWSLINSVCPPIVLAFFKRLNTVPTSQVSLSSVFTSSSKTPVMCLAQAST